MEASQNRTEEKVMVTFFLLLFCSLLQLEIIVQCPVFDLLLQIVYFEEIKEVALMKSIRKVFHSNDCNFFTVEDSGYDAGKSNKSSCNSATSVVMSSLMPDVFNFFHS